MSAEVVRAGEILRRLNGVPRLTGAEIGVFGGALSRLLLRRDGLFLYMVDSWLPAEEQPEHYARTKDYHAHLPIELQRHYYFTAMVNTEFAEDRRRVLRMDSVEASRQVANGSLDFVFIDANHTYQGCTADIEAWLPKVKVGGLLCGHDYKNTDFPEFEVDRAVDETVKRNGWDLDLGDNFTWFVRVV